MSEALGNLAEIQYGKSPNEVLNEDGPYPVVGTGGVYAHAMSYLYKSAIVVPRKGSLGKPWILREPVWPVDTTYAVVPNAGVNADWLFYNLLNFDLTKLNEATGVPSISRDWLRKVKFVNPGEPAQKKIARILRTVDEAIEKTEALIEKYSQIKAGMMQDLFTRGLTPDGKLRPPRSEAPELYQETPIGWIPTEWECAELEAVLAPVQNNIRSGPFGSALLKSELVEEGIPFLGIDNIHVERFDAQYKRFVSERKFNELQRYAVRPEDVVITIMGTVGRCAVVPRDIERVLSSKHLWTMTFDQGAVIPELVCWQLNYAPWVKAWFRRETQGGIMDAIQSRTLRTLKLPLPPLPEQQLIMKRFDVLQGTLRTETEKLAKLRHQKSGLMHDLLTGERPVKIDDPEPADV